MTPDARSGQLAQRLVAFGLRNAHFEVIAAQF